MAERNLYKIHFDTTFQNLRNHRKYHADDKKTVVANGDAIKAIQKLKKAVLSEPVVQLDDGERFKNIDVAILSVERLSQVDYA
jgi:intracellular sulfur oxidation DsrE/DsrF family protein